MKSVSFISALAILVGVSALMFFISPIYFFYLNDIGITIGIVLAIRHLNKNEMEKEDQYNKLIIFSILGGIITGLFFSISFSLIGILIGYDINFDFVLWIIITWSFLITLTCIIITLFYVGIDSIKNIIVHRND